jgi:hypothetical protein
MKGEYWLLTGLAIVGLILWGQAHEGCTDCQNRFAAMSGTNPGGGAGRMVRAGSYAS